jgi:hypothetical protein
MQRRALIDEFNSLAVVKLVVVSGGALDPLSTGVHAIEKKGRDVMKMSRIFVAVALFLALASCNLKPMSNVAGTWKQVGGPAVLEIEQGGVLTLISGDSSLTAKYMFTNDNRMEIYINGLGAMVVDVALANKELSLTNAQGEVVKYVRAK